MGDGRYYTFNQFITTIILVFLIIFITVILALSFFKKSNQKGDKFLLISLVLFDSIAIFRFVEVLFMNQNTNMIFRFIQITLLIFSYISFIHYLFSYITNYKSRGNKKVEKIIVFTVTVAMIGFLMHQLLSKGFNVISEYAVTYTLYSSFYTLFISSILILILYIMSKIYVSAKENNVIDKIKLTFTVIGVMYLLPLVIYLISLYEGFIYNDEIEIIIVFLGTIALNMLLNLKVSYGITPFAFDKLKGIMGDYVFVTDNNDKIVFKNDHAAKSIFFSDSDVLNLKNFESIFVYKITKDNNQHDINYIEMHKNEDVSYFSYRHSTLMNKNIEIGKVITFIDITEFVELLNKQKLQQTKMSRKNHELTEYKKIVYDIEKENEINSLLEKIVIIQEKNMIEIVSKIDKCLLNLDDSLLHKHLDEIIDLLGKNLESVRKAVNVYTKHYGGK